MIPATPKILDFVYQLENSEAEKSWRAAHR